MLDSAVPLFGTDGVRGVANVDLTPQLAMDLARAAGELAGSGTAVIGRDTRRSGEMLNGALHAGFHSVGIDTVDAGVIPVGGVSVLIRELGGELGVMISASHNPAPDNGIKFFDRRGAKLSDEQEHEIEGRLRQGPPYKVSFAEKVGTRYEVANARARYLKEVRESANFSFNGISVALDCAHGAAYKAAPELFEMLKADVTVHYAEPTGMNINDGCGATHPEVLSGLVDGRIGLSFDGDADRLMAVDEDGGVLNGDVIMAIIAIHMKQNGRLKNNVVVSTVMANLGFKKAMESHGIEVVQTQVGDRYVLQEMLARKSVLGGEQSGHVVFLDRAKTGDGLLTAVRLLEVIASTGKPLRDLHAEAMTEFPQVLLNVRVAAKERLADATALWDAVRDAEADLGEEGRVLVRASGTEPLVRVMVEASSHDRAATIAEALADTTESVLGTA